MKLFYILLGILLIAALKPMSAGQPAGMNPGLSFGSGSLTVLMTALGSTRDQEVP